MTIKRVMSGNNCGAIWDELDPVPATRPRRRQFLKLSLFEALVVAVVGAILAGMLLPVLFSSLGDFDYTHRYPLASPGAGNGFEAVAGEYTLGGLGLSWGLSILPDGRYSFRWSGCCGVYYRESGFVKSVGEYLVLSAVEPIEPRIAGSFFQSSGVRGRT